MEELIHKDSEEIDSSRLKGKTLAERIRMRLQHKMGTAAPVYDSEQAMLLDLSSSMDEGTRPNPDHLKNPFMPECDGPSRYSKLLILMEGFTDVRRFIFNDICKEVMRGQPIPTPEGGTNMALAFEVCKRAGIKHVILISDGRPNSDVDTLAAAAGLKIDCFYVGPDPAPDILRKLSEKSGGQYNATDLGKADMKQLGSKVRALLK
jgi:hypothetical protein